MRNDERKRTRQGVADRRSEVVLHLRDLRLVGDVSLRRTRRRGRAPRRLARFTSTLRISHASGTFSRTDSCASSTVAVPASVARSAAVSRFVASVGAIATSPSTRPRCRAHTDRFAATPESSSGIDNGPNTSLANPRPAPNTARAAAEVAGARRGEQREGNETRRDEHDATDQQQGRAQRAAESAREERGGGERAHDERAGERLVLPDLDDEEHPQEQRTDRRRADEGEREVGGDRLRSPRTRVPRRAGLLRHAMGEDSDQRERGDGGLQQEDGSPVEELGEQAPERRADHGSGDTGAGPQPATCGSRSVQRGEHRQRGPEHERRPGALQAPGEHEPGRLVRDACAERCECECREARDDEQPRIRPTSEGSQQEPADAHDERVGGDDPRDADDRGVELAVDLGECEHDDRRIGERERDRHHERDRPDRQARPRRARGAGGISVTGGGGGQARATEPPRSWPSIPHEATGAVAGASVGSDLGDRDQRKSDVAAPRSADTTTPSGSAPQ